MSLVSGTELLKLLDLLRVIAFVPNELTLGGVLRRASGWAAGHQKDQATIGGLEVSALPPDFQRGERARRLSSVTVANDLIIMPT